MKFNIINDDVRSAELSHLMSEGYGRTAAFDYDNPKHDPKPYVLVLGKYTHPSTGNKLVAGVNLNYCDSGDVEALQKALPNILATGKAGTRKRRNLKDRYWTGRRLLPSIFTSYYRTYRADFVHAIEPGTLKFYKATPPASSTPSTPTPTPTPTTPTSSTTSTPVIPTTPPPAEPKELDVPEPPLTLQGDEQTKDIIDPSDLEKLKNELEKQKKALETQSGPQIPQNKEKPTEGPENSKEEDLEDGAEDGTAKESRLRDLKMILGAYEIPETTIVNVDDYVTSHVMEEFLRQPRMCDGNRLLAVYDMLSEKLIMDFADSHEAMLTDADWEFDHTILFTLEEGNLVIHYTCPSAKRIIPTLLNGNFGFVVNRICGGL